MAKHAPSAVRFLPNMLTVLGLCAGLSVVQFVYRGRLSLAVAAIAAAAVLDAVDGTVARLLGAASKLGAELDSLSDSAAFGIAPALALYIWTLHTRSFGWAVSVTFAVCVALRLARYNAMLDDAEQVPFAKKFFAGVPAPIGGLLAMVPMTMTARWGEGWWSSTVLVSVWTVLTAVLLVSRIPTMSLKGMSLSSRAVKPLFVVAALAAVAFTTNPLGASVCLMFIYLLHVPYAAHRHYRLSKEVARSSSDER